MRQRLHHRVAGAELRLLQRPSRPGRERGGHLLAAMAVDDDDARGEAAGGVQHVREQRPASERVQDLGQGRVHALALPGGENDYVHSSCVSVG